MAETIRLTTSDGVSFRAFREPADDVRRGGIVMLHAIWGVTPHIRELAGEFAQIGYEVLAPSLFDRYGAGEFPDANTDPAVEARQGGFAKRSGWGANVMPEVQACVDALEGPVFVMGFCFGGTAAWLAACRCEGLAAASCFYGGAIFQHLDETPRCPTSLHFGKHDKLIPPSEVATIEAAHPDLPVWLYDAGHAFMAPSGFHADSARLARLRTLQLFARSAGVREGN